MSPSCNPSVVLVGCGRMGAALLDGWLDRRMASAIWVVDPSDKATQALRRSSDVTVVADHRALPREVAPEVIVLAVKPQTMGAVAPLYADYKTSAVFLSVAAGKTMAGLEALLGGSAALVRCMPNTPAAVRRGITAMCANALTSARQKTLCQDLLSAVGDTLWVEDEGQLDAVTAVSGSGPAYVFLLAECLAEAGQAAGLPVEIADRLARATVSGAGELLHQSEQSSKTLRDNVTSPGGTTAAALEILAGDDGLRPLIKAAVAAAAARSKALAD